MFGYRDRTYCSSYILGNCVNHNCNRAFTTQDREYAIKWWGNEDFPLCTGDLQKEGCGFEPAETKNPNITKEEV